MSPPCGLECLGDDLPGGEIRFGLLGCFHRNDIPVAECILVQVNEC